MSSKRIYEIIIGTLFFISTISYIIGNSILEDKLLSKNLLNDFYSNKTIILTGIFFELLNCACVISIGILMIQFIKNHNYSISIIYFSCRLIEGLLLIISAISPYFILKLSNIYLDNKKFNIKNEEFNLSIDIVGRLLSEGYFIFFKLAMAFLSLGSIVLCLLLLKSNIIPKILSVFGIIGYISLLLHVVLNIIGYEIGMILFAPGAVFEIIFPLNLIINGFNDSVGELNLSNNSESQKEIIKKELIN